MATDDTYIEDLNQIKDRQKAVLDEIDRIREKYGTVPKAIEEIQANAVAAVIEIDAIRERESTRLKASQL